MSATGICPKCGEPVFATAPEGLCPRCLLRSVLASRPRTDRKERPEQDEAAAFVAPMTEKPGNWIGHYKLLQQIGEGGSGVVYVAEQDEPVRRRVALKVIKLGMDTKEVIARFEAEQQALALMDHPNIAKVLDAGATNSGRPFFVMELVRGVPITGYCDVNNLDTRQRLDLFIQVCHAIQHAHQKGIIHRDIKPSNILVADYDGVPVPKVIDFGIAKATAGQTLTDKTVFTAFEQFIGTPAYMSPEQAKLSGLDVDTRTDIYSLGVLLYEVLTSKTPFDAKELLQAGLDEMRRTIREKEPVRPSTRLSVMLQDELTTTAKRRRIESLKLIQLLRGDLDWIVMKCLEKDRNRRYETANGLALDVKRHLDHQPVFARPPTAGYRFRKLVRRNKLAFAAAAVVLAVLVLGIVVSTWQAVRATRAEHDKALLFEKAQKAQADEAMERELAVRRLYDSLVGEARATRIARHAGYRDRVFDLLQQAHALNVPQQDLALLRQEAGACLGDFVGRSPATFSILPGKAKISSIGVDPSSRLAAFLMTDGAIVLRELPSGKEVARLADKEPVTSFCFNPAGDRILTVHVPPAGSAESASARVLTWVRSVEGRWLQTNQVSIPGAADCVWTQSRAIVVVSTKDSIDFVDLNGLAVVNRIEHSPQGGASTAAISPDGRLFVMGDESVLGVWDANTGQRVRSLDHGLSSVNDILFSPDGQQIACIADSGCAIYATEELRHITTLAEFATPWTRASFGPGGVLALPLYQQNRVRLWDALRSQDLAFLDVPSGATMTAFSPDGTWFLASDGYGTWLFSLTMNAEKLSLPGQIAGVSGVCFSPDGKSIATVGKDRTLRVWDAVTGRQVWQGGPLPHQGQFVSYSPDGRFLATTTYGLQSVWVWDVLAKRTVLKLGPNKGGVVWSAQFSSDGRKLVTASTGDRATGDGAIGKEATGDGPSGDGVTVWSLDSPTPGRPNTGLTAKAVKWLEGQYWSLVVAPDDQYLAFQRLDTRFERNPYLWDWRGTASPLLVTTNALNNNQIASFTTDSRQLIILDSERNILTIDVRTGNQVLSFATLGAKHNDAWAKQPSLCLSPDGKQLAISSLSRLGVDIWDPKTGRLLYSLPEQRGTVYWLAWSLNSERLAISRSDGDVSIWNLREAERVLSKVGLNPDEQDNLAGVRTLGKGPARGVENQTNNAALLRSRADLRARSSHWKEAAEDLSEVLRQDPGQYLSWSLLAGIVVKSGDLVAYSHHCHAMLTRFGETSDPLIAGEIAKASLLVPVDGLDLTISGKLANAALAAASDDQRRARFQFVRGLAEYRLGHFMNAIEWMERVLVKPEVGNRDLQACAVLAMARHQLDQESEAHSALIRAVAIAETELPKLDRGPSWEDWIIGEILLSEAKGIVDHGSNSADGKK
jgi:serine/threonine protein kinase/WD40 repeat protein